MTATMDRLRLSTIAACALVLVGALATVIALTASAQRGAVPDVVLPTLATTIAPTPAASATPGPSDAVVDPVPAAGSAVRVESAVADLPSRTIEVVARTSDPAHVGGVCIARAVGMTATESAAAPAQSDAGSVVCPLLAIPFGGLTGQVLVTVEIDGDTSDPVVVLLP